METINYCILAKSIPEYSKRDGTIYTCSIGYSPQKGLIRIYPLPIVSMNKWEIWQVPIEKNKMDSRTESWKLASYSRKEDFIGLDKDAKVVGYDSNRNTLKYITSHVYPSISYMNEKRVSVGLIKLDEYNLYWDKNERHIDTRQIGLFEDVEIASFTTYTKETKQKKAMVKFRDADGFHNIQYNNWGVYEYQRKFKADDKAFRFLYGGDKYILLGNMNGHRNVWIGLEILELQKQLHLF